MSEKKEIRPLTEATIAEIHRITCADYLRLLADKVDEGKIAAFELTWNTDIRKPTGRMAVTPDIMSCEQEEALEQRIREYRAEQAQLAQAIQVVDVSEKLQDHEPCDDEHKEDCALCNTGLS